LTTPTRVLLIDDDAQHRCAIDAALAGANLIYSLVEAHTAQSGLIAAAQESFDCVLLDCELADVDVSELLARLTSAEGGRQAVIALTGEIEPDAAVALLRAGAVDSISRQEADGRTLARAIRYAKARRGFVIELQAAREDAEAKSHALDRLNRQKTLILSIIAHDLRNPFQVLLGMSRSLSDGAEEATARRAAGLHEAAGQAHGLLESLFSWASLHMDARASEMERIGVDALFGDCVRALQERADAKGVKLEAPPAGLSVRSQEDGTAAILRNLSANAIKFTAAGGGVTLSAARRQDGIALCVTDTGVGMDEAQTAALFQLENRATSAGTAGERGAGLGLLLCRDLAEWIGGVLEVESRLGEGTTFRLVLPEAEAG
jgi:signal transduction histidine kinase